MRPVSSVSGRPAHSIVLRLISNMFRLSYPAGGFRAGSHQWVERRAFSPSVHGPPRHRDGPGRYEDRCSALASAPDNPAARGLVLDAERGADVTPAPRKNSPRVSAPP